MNRSMDGWVGWINEWMDVMNGWVDVKDEWMRWMDRWIDEQMNGRQMNEMTVIMNDQWMNGMNE